MSNAVSNHIEVTPYEKVRDYYVEKTFLFGLLGYNELQRRESLGTELRITCQKTPEKVSLNGVEYKPCK